MRVMRLWKLPGVTASKWGAGFESDVLALVSVLLTAMVRCLSLYCKSLFRGAVTALSCPTASALFSLAVLSISLAAVGPTRLSAP